MLAATTFTASGCMGASGGPSFDVEAYNHSAQAVEMGLRATFDDTGKVVFEESAMVEPGESERLGRLRGPRGDYHLEGWAGDLTAGQGPGFGLDSAGLGCDVWLSDLGRLDVLCSTT